VKLIILSLLMIVACAHKSTPTLSPISFKEEGKTFTADLSIPPQMKSPAPLVIIVHEFWGKNQYVKSRAKQINALGYVTLTVDMYGDNKLATSPHEAMDLSKPFYEKPELGVRRLQKYIELAQNDPHIDPLKIFVIGYCFGGLSALNLARSGLHLSGVVSFHGPLKKSYPASKKIETPILVLHGDSDPVVPSKDVVSFKQEMKRAHAKITFLHYKHATHAFTNPEATDIGKKWNLPVAYSKEADEASWKAFTSFLKKYSRP